jgi:uncharacterized protein (DUF2384 family)
MMTYLAEALSTEFDLTSLKSRQQLTKMVMRLLDEWQLPTAEQLALLGLRETSRNMLSRYRNLESTIPYDQDKLDRLGILLAIYKNLYDLFPENENLRKSWITRKNSHLNNMRPMDIMLTEGLFGMAHIMRYLDLQVVH